MKSVYLSAPELTPDVPKLVAALAAESIEVSCRDRLLPGTGTDLLDEVLSMINRSSVFVAILYGDSPNVLFEIGYALGRGKDVLLLPVSGCRVPFDLASIQAISVDRFDDRTMGAVVEWIKKATGKTDSLDFYSLTTTEILRLLCENELFLDAISHEALVDCIANLLHEHGINVDVSVSGKDGGFDLRVDDDEGGLPRAIIEIKKQNRNSRLGVNAVQQIVGAAMQARVELAIIITSAGFTQSATFLANNSSFPVALITLEELVDGAADSFRRLCNAALKKLRP